MRDGKAPMYSERDDTYAIMECLNISEVDDSLTERYKMQRFDSSSTQELQVIVQLHAKVDTKKPIISYRHVYTFKRKTMGSTNHYFSS
jgi:hypothetical protein